MEVESGDSESPPPRNEYASIPPDGGYGWMVVLGSFIIHLFVLGNVYSFGVLYPVLVEAFNSNLGTAAWIGSIGFGIMTGIASMTGIWADKYGNRPVAFIGGIIIALAYFLASLSTDIWQLFLSFGVLAGIGYSLSFVAAVSVVSQWFTSNRGLAVGMAVAGSGMGQFTIALVAGRLLSSFGWRTTMQYLALINLVGISIGAALIKRFMPCFVRPKSESTMHYFNNRNFTILYCAVVFASLGSNMQFVHLAKYALVYGLSYSNAVLLVAVMGAASAVGRIILGYLADHAGKMIIFRICFVCSATTTFCWAACTNFPSLLAFAIFFGLFGGGLISLIPSVTSLLFGLEQQGNVLGLIFTGSALGNLLSSPIAGFLYDAFGEYYPSILLAGAFISCGCLFVMILSVDENARLQA